MENRSRIKELYEDFLVLKRALRFVWVRRSTYFIYSAVAFVLAIIVAFSIPKTYSTSVQLAPENSQGVNLNLAALGSLGGMNLGTVAEDAYSIELYPTITSSTDFLLPLKDIKVFLVEENKEITYGEYLLKYRKKAWWNASIGYLQGAVKRLFKKPKSNKGGASRNSMPRLSEQELALCSMMQNNILCLVDKITGVITIKAYATDAEVSAVVADSVTKSLNNFVLNYRTSKARADYEYMKKVCDEYKEKYMQAQKVYADYIESHTNIYSQSYKVHAEYLEQEAMLAYTLYSQMLTQTQMSQAKIMESTPIYTVIESAYVPEFHDSPQKVIIFVVFIFMACIAATIKLVYSKLARKRWKVKA